MVIKRCEDLDVYNMAFERAMQIFDLTKDFPKSETYSLVDQIRRSSRSVCANIREGYAKRKYPDIFVKQLNDALGSSEETLTWLDFAYKSGYLDAGIHKDLKRSYEAISSMIYKLMTSWQKY